MVFRRKRNLPIDEHCINDYLKKEYPYFDITGTNNVVINNFRPLRQGYFNDRLNCSITSITAAICYYSDDTPDVNEVYTYVRRVAKRFLYTPGLIGTLSFTIGPIYSICLHHFGIEKRSGYGLIKGLGFGKRKIKKLINEGKPVILSLFRDGRCCYNNHTVTVIGYRTYYCKNKEVMFLMLNDNWSDEIRFLDYKKLWLLSAINY